jgi:hypothetical protein
MPRNLLRSVCAGETRRSSTLRERLTLAAHAEPEPDYELLGLLTWSGGFVNYYPTSGWDFYASTQETVTRLILAALFGLLLPLQVAAVTKARSAAGTAGGVIGTAFGVFSMSCCAPLILPALLSFVGFSGMTLLQVNVTVHEWATPLTVASIGFMVLAIGLVSRTITAVCELQSRRT